MFTQIRKTAIIVLFTFCTSLVLSQLLPIYAYSQGVFLQEEIAEKGSVHLPIDFKLSDILYINGILEVVNQINASGEYINADIGEVYSLIRDAVKEYQDEMSTSEITETAVYATKTNQSFQTSKQVLNSGKASSNSMMSTQSGELFTGYFDNSYTTGLFERSQTGNVSITPFTGEVMVNDIDFSMPGKNGMDLTLATRYDS